MEWLRQLHGGALLAGNHRLTSDLEAMMPDVSARLVDRLYGRNIWDGFVPIAVESEVQGWNGNHPSLARLVSSPGPKIVVDVGVWKGQSTISMAAAMRDRGIDGVVIGVDTFLGSPEHWVNNSSLFSRQNGFPDLYRTFLSNVVHAGLEDYVIPMPQTSTTACSVLKRLEVKASVIHVDAAHEYREVLMDLQDY